MNRITFTAISILLTFFMQLPCSAATGTWASKTLGKSVSYTATEAAMPAKDGSNAYMTVVYLENLGCEKIGRNSNSDDVAWLLSQGYRVIELNYGGDARATAPYLNEDIIAINDELNGGTFCGCSNISSTRAYILFEGYRIQRDVSYYLDSPSTYNYPDAYTKTAGDSLYMDIVYPANPGKAVPTMLSFAYSNSYYGKSHQRMFLGYTLAMFDDSILEGLPAIGMAWAIADHPKYCDWGQGKYTGGANKSLGAIEVNPDAARKVKSAVRTLRKVGSGLGLGNDIGLYGFSRGSTAASLGIGDAPFDEWLTADNGRADAKDVSSDIQIAVLGPGVFDYSKMSETSNEYKRMKTYCNSDWTQQGGAMAIKNKAVPCFLFYNSDDDANYATQMSSLMSIFDNTGTTYELLKDYGKGHSVPTQTADIKKMYDFLQSNVSTGVEVVSVNECSDGGVYDLSGRKMASNISATDNLPSGIYVFQGKKFVR